MPFQQVRQVILIPTAPPQTVGKPHAGPSAMTHLLGLRAWLCDEKSTAVRTQSAEGRSLQSLLMFTLEDLGLDRNCWLYP